MEIFFEKIMPRIVDVLAAITFLIMIMLGIAVLIEVFAQLWETGI